LHAKFEGDWYRLVDGNNRMIEDERTKASLAIEETRKVKICLGELERQIAALQHQLRQAGVEQHHIESALTRSGLVHLVQSNRVGVFERLYQDALDRMVKMDKIRERFRDIQRAEYMRLMKDGGSRNIPPQEYVPPEHMSPPPRTSPSTRLVRSPLSPSVHARRASASGLVPEKYLSAHSVMGGEKPRKL
jgi:hypothetical protein